MLNSAVTLQGRNRKCWRNYISGQRTVSTWRNSMRTGCVCNWPVRSSPKWSVHCEFRTEGATISGPRAGQSHLDAHPGIQGLYTVNPAYPSSFPRKRESRGSLLLLTLLPQDRIDSRFGGNDGEFYGSSGLPDANKVKTRLPGPCASTIDSHTGPTLQSLQSGGLCTARLALVGAHNTRPMRRHRCPAIRR